MTSPDFFEDLDEDIFETPSQKRTAQATVPDFFEGLEDTQSSMTGKESSFSDKLIPSPFQGKKPDSNKSVRQNILDIYRPEEKTPEQLKSMSVQERREFAQELQNLRDLQSGTGLVKGALSGLTLSASEHIPGLKPDEDDLMVGLGETIGSYAPIAGLYNLMGKPLVNLAAKSPIARQGLMAFARMTGFGATGAAYEAGKDIVQGEIPSPEELAKTGATWAAIDGVLQAMGLGVAFNSAIRNIAEKEGVTTKEVLGKLWDSSKNYIKSKFGRSVEAGDIIPADVEVLADKVMQAEAEGLSPKKPTKPKEIELQPQEKPLSEVEPEPIRPIEENIESISDEQIESSLTEAKEQLKELEQTQGKGATKEKSALIQQINELELEKHNRGKETQVKEAPFKDVKNEPRFKDGKQIQFPAGTVGDYIKSSEVRKALKDVLDYPIAILDHPKNFVGTYVNNEPLFINKRVGSMTSKVRAVLHEAIHLLQDKKGRLNYENLSMPYNERPQEITAHKFHEWAVEKESEAIKALKEKGESWNYPKPQEASPPTPHESKQRPLTESKVKEIEHQDISRKGLKNQKEYILDEVENALQNPPEGDQVLIDVPGDGEFRINNNPQALQKFGKAVEKKWPVTPVGLVKPPAHKVKPPVKEKPSYSEKTQEYLSKKETNQPSAKTRPLKPTMGKEQAVSRSKIIKLFRTAFTDPIRIGKISKKNALGIHKLWPKVTRLLNDNDIETAAHEIGHNLHTTLYGGDAADPKEQFRNIEKALKPYLDELKPLAHYEPWGMEGFAEFTRLYVTNPDVAKELAPNFYAKFEADLGAQYPEMKNALLEARDYYDKYLQGTPQSRIRAQTSYAQDKGKLANIIDSVKKMLTPDTLKTQFLDDVYPAKRLVAEAFGIPISEVENLKDEANLYRSLRVLKGAVGKGDVFILHETFNAKTLDKINGSLRDILKKLPDEESYREFNDYLIARRAIEKADQKVETGIEFGDAVAVEQELRGKYGELAKELDKYNDTLLSYARDSGLISKDQYAKIKKNNLMYVPFQRDMSKGQGVASGAGSLQAGKPIKKMKGSTRDIIAPIESVIKNTYAIIINSEKNLTGQVLAKIAQKQNVGAYVEAVPTPIGLKAKVTRDEIESSVIKHLKDTGQGDLLEMSDGKLVLRSDLEDIIPDLILKFGATTYPAGENIVTVYFEGKPKYYEVSPEIHEMWTKGMAPYTAGLLTKILRIPATVLRAGAILNPRFMQKNFIRDTWGGILFTKYGKSIKDPAGLFIDTLYSPLSMLSVAAKKGPLYVEFMKAGGGMSTMQSLDRNTIVKKLDEIRKGIKPHQVIKWLRKVAEISEEGNRLAEFGRALEVEGKTRLGREIAAFAARDLSIDFAKIGLQTKVLNQIIPFWNATVQGGDKLLRALNNPKDRKEFLPRILGLIVLPSLMLAWLNKDDENVKEFYEEEKDFNFIIPINGEYFKIPVPFETGVIAHGLTQRMFNHFMKEDPEAFEGFMGSVKDAMQPNVIPAFANPMIESWVNKNFFTGGRIIPAGKEGLTSKYQYKNYTSSTARLLGRAMAYMIGNEDTRSKAASPAIIDHFINSWGGGLGRILINISDASLEAAGLIDKIQGPEKTITEKLGLDAFTARFPRASTRSIEKFYDNYADATARQKSASYAHKMDLESEEEIEKSYKRIEKIYDYPSMKRAYTAIQSCQKEINNIWNDPSIEQDFKKQMVDDLYKQMIDFAKAANEDIKQYRLAQE